MTANTDDYDDTAHGGARSWIPLSAEQIRRRSFRETPLGRRGYRPDEVELFVGRVAGEVERWTAAYADAQNEVQRLKYYFRNEGVDPDAPRAWDVTADAVALMSRAQLQADRLIADAQAHARAMQHDARAQAEAIVGRARQEADRAAHAYRARAGSDYNADREQAERMGTLGRSILAALSGATTQMDGASAQMRAIADAFAIELGKIITELEEAHTGRTVPPAP
jgi:DivIVA domain-containing protein